MPRLLLERFPVLAGDNGSVLLRFSGPTTAREKDRRKRVRPDLHGGGAEVRACIASIKVVKRNLIAGDGSSSTSTRSSSGTNRRSSSYWRCTSGYWRRTRRTVRRLT